MFLIALALSAAAGPERWVRVGGSANGYEEYLDTQSVRRRGNRATAWTRRDFAGDQVTAWHEHEFHCSARTETLLAYIRDDRGTVSHSTVRPHRKASPIRPGSVEDRIFNRVCR